ncbi:Nramp family divalent metal transporter [Aliidiomarina haloalkalitolerans]|uniref:Manganese transporter n=1 Tax=Aliidiomarina haloalkalitolerans TaxID=859059 RepID=A0A432VSX3_9GAMM|nr:Nramp family divalent metal transporter [Aliidiomarina haloalkalitolerans]MCL4408819.1 Nramp family divalent metal transporter [Gammaproteobacteria bacterium]RUO19512.1 manganese transporter [Aliidiomarina haloalkalitolerans]
MLKLGPATLVAAAFIGPGTVVTASVAGASFGYALVWALAFAIVATMILQEMSARVGVVTQRGLGENLRTVIERPSLRLPFYILVIAAVVIGNAAYQGGNLTGASIGAEGLLGTHPFAFNLWAVVIGAIAVIVLWQGKYKTVERTLIGLVMLMSVAFLITFFLTRPDWLSLVRGFVPRIPDGGAFTMMALIGTTIVPYALFLHADSARERWQDTETKQALREARADIATSIPIGGLITLAILSTSASAFFAHQLTIQGPADLANSIEPVFGRFAGMLMGAGLFAAGISSAITAPLASAYALTGILGWSRELNGKGFRAVWLGIILIGVTLSSLEIRPLTLILFAQVTNGLLLPLIALFLLLAVNHRAMGQYRNNRQQNLLGFIVFLFACLLCARTLWFAFN